MNVGQDFFPKSSFLTTDKDLALIFQKILDNQRLLKMLYYTQRDALKAPDLTPEQKMSMIDHQLRIVPQLTIDKECPIFVIIGFDNFTPNATNTEFRDCTLTFDILCHPDHWNLGNYQLRPYKIAGELDAMFNKSHMTGIGRLEFLGANNLVLNE